MRTLKLLFKYLFLSLIGGTIYYCIELIYKGGESHWSMFVLGSICFVILGLLNEFLSWETPLWKQMTYGAIIITALEFITGCIVNLWLCWNVWDYTGVWGNILGQICLPFTIIWFFLSFVGIVLDDYIRYWCFDEEKPHYKLV